MLLFNVSKARSGLPQPSIKSKLAPFYRQADAKAFCKPIVPLLVGLATATSLSSCSHNSPADRKVALEKFCTSVTQHMFDRNPLTITESLNTMLHEELSDAARQKLEDTHVIPDSPITVLKDKQEWTTGHKSNRVDVGIVRALTPIEQKDVTFRISGKDWDLVNGKQTDYHPFQFDMVVELTPEMDGLARVLDVQGLGKTPVAANTSDSSPKASVAKHKRRR